LTSPEQRPAGERPDQAPCPFTPLYWDFLDRNRERLASNWRMRLQYRNLERLDGGELREIRAQAAALRRNFAA
jgi:deoxyribodipyrimidine photolyase-related protein